MLSANKTTHEASRRLGSSDNIQQIDEKCNTLFCINKEKIQYLCVKHKTQLNIMHKICIIMQTVCKTIMKCMKLPIS